MMKYLKRTGLVLGLTLFTVTAVLADARIYKLHVDGLACPFCAYGVEKKVGGLTGVEKVEIDIDGGLVAVILADGATLIEVDAARAVDEAGFTLRRFETPQIQ